MRGCRWLPVSPLALHIAVFLGLARFVDDAGAQAEGQDGLLVTLAPAGSAAGNADRHLVRHSNATVAARTGVAHSFAQCHS